MKNLNKLALALTTENLVKSRSSKKSINSYLVDILSVDAKLKKSRIELTNEITLARLQESEIVTEKSFEDAEFVEKFKKVNKTVKNGLDTSIAKGKSGSCFISSAYSADWELISNDDKTFSMIARKK
jgi:hypothetical protein